MSGMASYFIRRLLLVPITFVLITMMVYTVLRYVPGGPIEQAEAAMKMSSMEGGGGGGGIGDEADLQLNEEDMRELRRYYSLDKPVLVGYAQWLGIMRREFFTRVHVETLERESESFAPILDLKRASDAAATELEGVLAPLGFITFNGRFYRPATEEETTRPTTDADRRAAKKDKREVGERVPTDFFEDAKELDEKGFGKRDELLAFLDEEGFTFRDKTYFKLLDDADRAAHRGEVENASALLGAVRAAADRLEEIRAQHGFEITEDGRIYQIESKWAGILQLDFGRSYTRGEPVLGVIWSKMEVSIQFGLIGYFMSWLICVPLGIFKAIKHRSWFDTVTSVLVFLGFSVPGFVLCLVLLAYVASSVSWLPLGGYKPDNIEEMTLIEGLIGRARHMLIPVTGYMIGSFATMTILMKNSLLENLSQDYVRTAFAKGLSEKRVIFVHALRNSLIPITAGVGHAVGLLFAGSFLIEKTCNIDGMGLMGYEAIIMRDYPIILGVLVFGVLIRLLGNILSDLIWATIDPRIRFG